MRPLAAWAAAALWLGACGAASAQAANLLANPGMEGGASASVPAWTPYGDGYAIDADMPHDGAQCLRCGSGDTSGRHGAMQVVTLRAPAAGPLQISGWSRADGVSGSTDDNYSVYADLTYVDGSNLWGQAAVFQTGTHGWQRASVLIHPSKPIRSITVYALFRNHAGTAWFDDFSASIVSGTDVFDDQPYGRPPRPESIAHLYELRAGPGFSITLDARGELTGTRVAGRDVTGGYGGGFYIRDVAANERLVPLRGTVDARHGGLHIGLASDALGIVFNAQLTPARGGIEVSGEVADRTHSDRAVTVYLALPVDAVGWQWAHDIRHSELIGSQSTCTDQVAAGAGATGSMSLYPLGTVFNTYATVGVRNSLEYPTVARIFYSGATRQLVIAWDFGLSTRSSAWPTGTAQFRCLLFGFGPPDGAYGMRAALARWYRDEPATFGRRAAADGIWMPFTSPETVRGFQDFHFGYHEGDNSVAADDAAGILSFRYTEPMTWWMPMKPDVPRTYDAAMAQVRMTADGPPGGDRDHARAVLNSGTQDASGRFNVEFRHEPWADGAVFILNPNPELPHTDPQPTIASLNYSIASADRRFAPGAAGQLDGEYLDSLEGWGDTLDYRPISLASSSVPLTFATSTRAPALPEWFSVFAYTRFLRDDLHNRSRLLMANGTPGRFAALGVLPDVAGTEVNWLDAGGQWSPDSDEVMNLRRTIAATKPYLLLMNTDFNRFGNALVDRYMQRCMFYGIFPSMFSRNASDDPYWAKPAWYDRDRGLFARYIPIIARLSHAGWAPVTYAAAADPLVYVERFGPSLFTVRTDARAARATFIDIDAASLGMAGATAATDLVTGHTLALTRAGSSIHVAVTVAPDQTLVLELR